MDRLKLNNINLTKSRTCLLMADGFMLLRVECRLAIILCRVRNII